MDTLSLRVLSRNNRQEGCGQSDSQLPVLPT